MLVITSQGRAAYLAAILNIAVALPMAGVKVVGGGNAVCRNTDIAGVCSSVRACAAVPSSQLHASRRRRRARPHSLSAVSICHGRAGSEYELAVSLCQP